jgi:hypothetical protein
VIARRQLLAVGLKPPAIDYRVQHGRLHVVHRGVYSVGHSLLSRDGRWMAAVFAGGDGAVLSHRDAAAAWGIRESAASRIEITVSRKCSRQGVRVHRAPLAADEVTIFRGIPVTTVPRTIFDLAAGLDRRRVERVMHEAEVLRLTDPLSLDDLIVRHPRHRGIATLRAILADARLGASVTRSELEERFLAFLDDAGLPRPETNVIVWVRGKPVEADCVWRDRCVIVELDGHHVHSTRRNYEGDRARDRALAAAEWRVVRITWRQLHDEPSAVAADLRALLGG